jgi:hypothetical protein
LSSAGATDPDAAGEAIISTAQSVADAAFQGKQMGELYVERGSILLEANNIIIGTSSAIMFLLALLLGHACSSCHHQLMGLIFASCMSDLYAKYREEIGTVI